MAGVDLLAQAVQQMGAPLAEVADSRGEAGRMQAQAQYVHGGFEQLRRDAAEQPQRGLVAGDQLPVAVHGERGVGLQALEQQIDASHDPQLIALLRELQALPSPAGESDTDVASSIAVPLQLEVDGHILSMFSTTTVFGTPVDITLAELALEAFVPADAQTAERLRAMAG